ncbi:FAD-dependent oxidoreductase [Amycolatopsis lurida]
MNETTLHVRSGGSEDSPDAASRKRIAIVGGGLAGLSAGVMLVEDGRWDVTIFERRPFFGGRAAGNPIIGEHCPRLMLRDYTATRDLLGRIPGVYGNPSVSEALTRVRRMDWGPRGQWIELDHINRLRASGLTLRDQFAMYRQARKRPSVAEEYGPNQNVFGRWRQFSLRSLVEIFRNTWQADQVFAFPGSTNTFLVEPMIDHLKAHDVELFPSSRVTRLMVGEDSEGVGDQAFDAVVLALFPSDLAGLLDLSGIRHKLRTSLRHAQCKVLTIAVDSREVVLEGARPLLFCRAGLAILVQPWESRCIVLCTRAASTDDDYVLRLVREFLSLEYDFGPVAVRANQSPGEAVWSATMPKPSSVLPNRPRGVYLAGSWLASGYPYDSAESAIRSARIAVDASCHELF